MEFAFAATSSRVTPVSVRGSETPESSLIAVQHFGNPSASVPNEHASESPKYVTIHINWRTTFCAYDILPFSLHCILHSLVNNSVFYMIFCSYIKPIAGFDPPVNL